MNQILKQTFFRLANNPILRPLLRQTSHSGFLPDVIWQRLPVQETFYVPSSSTNGFQYRSVHGDAIGRTLFWRGWTKYESETSKVFYELAQDASCVVDVGANTGFFTLLACSANPHSNVISFEPTPRIFDCLTENIRLNHWEERCHPYKYALADTQGFTKFHVPHYDIPTSASLNIHGFRGYEGELIEVPVGTLDEFCVDQRVDLVKIDVEGFEDRVLRGMKHLLSTSAPTIIVECNPDGPYRFIDEFLTSYGYVFYHLRGDGPVKVSVIEPDSQEQYRNFLCIRKDKVEAMRLLQ